MSTIDPSLTGYWSDDRMFTRFPKSAYGAYGLVNSTRLIALPDLNSDRSMLPCPNWSASRTISPVSTRRVTE